MCKQVETTTITHHWPVTFTVEAQPVAGEHPTLAFTRAIAHRLSANVGVPVNYMTFQQFRYDAPAELRGWTRHHVGIAGHLVTIVGTPDPYLSTMPCYRVEVDGRPISYPFTFTRPLAELLADSASVAIEIQPPAPRQ